MKKIIYIPLIFCIIIYLLFANANWSVNPGEWYLLDRWIESALFGVFIFLGIVIAKMNKL